MHSFSASPTYLLTSLVKNRRLMFDLARRDAVGRYKGSALGILWSMLTPLLMLSVYTFVFSGVFKSRWGGESTPGSHSEFAVVLFAGMLTFNIFSECVNRAPSLVLANTNFVKKIVFPLEILPCVSLLSALFHASISITILLVAEFLIQGSVPITALLLPVVLTPLCLLILGISWLLSATGVYLRDIGQTIGILVTALMFLSPIFFPLSSLPENIRNLVYWNPLTFPIEQSRNVLIWGKPIDWTIWCGYLAISLIVSWIGFAWFQKTRKGFADVI
ncbi:ABC transporter permease [Burkholderia multivorans]|uniref:Transport permease protein n=1 Tax=Burkholderia multivorans CGD2 TaxID=513052 RepID=B9BSY0_9BURK|nr:ABC transporter permease [Burkholderia multivorans]EEE06200.1 ABC-2 type transporter [Burkholderia multivorans CGD2]EEE11348.1 ABC-2 type transporter [Burkholderia multivorans CGD2M]MBU9368021.1 ABC transporter permease [Burkholderia multivorans]MCO1360000.1 ABC transporter permease [Burkholderia multivorans]MCO1419765.1 ABC transporter permease [Burkholderia multivorans]